MKGIPMIHDVRERGECEIVNPRTLEPACKRPATLRYPAMGGGYMRLCDEHGGRHAKYCGRWNGEQWTPSPCELPTPEAQQ